VAKRLQWACHIPMKLRQW